jgi:hypothetical protein
MTEEQARIGALEDGLLMVMATVSEIDGRHREAIARRLRLTAEQRSLTEPHPTWAAKLLQWSNAIAAAGKPPAA